MLHTIHKSQIIKSNMDEVWAFMSSPKNLAIITPDYMGFKILSDPKTIEFMYPGQIIEYNISPVLGLKLNWVTEITQVKANSYFIDEQRFGPYTFWHHQHFFKETSAGIEMTDLIHYKLPWGFLGKIANSFFIQKQLESIFNYRKQKINEIYNTY